MGDFFRSNGYNTYFKGKWHVSDADIFIPGTHNSLLSYNALTGVEDTVNSSIYMNSNRLGGYGFDGWIGPEPAGSNAHNTGSSARGEVSGRDIIYSKEVCDLINDLDNVSQNKPWVIITSFVNPHDIAYYGEVSNKLPQFNFEIDETIPYVERAPTANEDLTTKPKAQQSYKQIFQKAFQPTIDNDKYRKLYYSLQLQVDREICKVLDSIVKSKFYEDTIIIFTSDHGELLGAHGMFQKFYNAYEETLHVPFIIHNPKIFPKGFYTNLLTSHVDILPTMLGLANINQEKALKTLKKDHKYAQPLVGRDLSTLIFDRKKLNQEPVYFMTSDDITKGLNQVNFFGEKYKSVVNPNNIESIVVYLDTGEHGKWEKWKLSRYYDTNLKYNDFIENIESNKEEYEMYNITRDPLETLNLANDIDQDFELKKIKNKLEEILKQQSQKKRKYPVNKG
ncbi:sulfatase-like hydrolase/transferase [Paraclostridium bifermentans]|uniref:Sulfatase-like hydrolase/transferase n=1 Tax=Paraclostridium bifermentans TaxID=1490 RepID=A0ABY8R6S7_PARBF|nr:sulfatase-like hydrolase/transferase [Paraclostridium bifermentans]